MIYQKDRGTFLSNLGPSNSGPSNSGFSTIELLIALAISGILLAIAIPQMVAQRRLLRSVAVTREIATQLRYARQLAMSQSGATPTGALRRVAYTFQYDDGAKAVQIIGPIPSGTAALADPAYPNITGSSVLYTIPLTQSGLTSAEISSGIPTGMPGAPSAVDGITGASLSGGKINITFQPDGSVIDATNTPVDQAIFLYNNQAAQQTASAISVRGSSGRIKIWRYAVNANANSSRYVD